MTFEETVRKRPAMFIGNDGAAGLFAYVIVDCIKLNKTGQLYFKIEIAAENDFILTIKAQQNINLLFDQFDNADTDLKHFYPKVLKSLAEKFEISSERDSEIQIQFSFRKAPIEILHTDYFTLCNKLSRIALLNSKVEILIVDKRHKYFSQNYFHFPEGIFYMFEREIKKALGKPEFRLSFDGIINSNKYQIGIAYRKDWHPAPNIMSFANDTQTHCGGSLVDGIVDGIICACRIYVKKNGLTNYNIKRKKFFNGLIIVCAVRGDEYTYKGSCKEVLEDENVKKQAKQIVTRLVLDFFYTQKENAENFLWRFDSSKFGSDMF